jgi:hypothetical protein
VNIPLALNYNACSLVCNIYALGVTTTLANTNAVYGSATTGSGVYGTASSSGNGVSGTASGTGNWVYGTSSGGAGVYGIANAWGVWGESTVNGGTGVEGLTNGQGIGVEGLTNTGYGVHGVAGTGYAVYAAADVFQSGGVALWANDGGNGIGAIIDSYQGTGMEVGLHGRTNSFFNGDLVVGGNLSKGGGSFKIDHPVDPANKYLYHFFVESPDMKNVYDGTIFTDHSGNATVTLPEWFETLNRDFRYQLTTIGQPARAWVASEIVNNRFTIKTDKPNVKVSWQVTGNRQDAWANAHRIPVEEAKVENERGFYLHPELYGQSPEKGMEWARHPEKLCGMKERAQAFARHWVRPLFVCQLRQLLLFGRNRYGNLSKSGGSFKIDHPLDRQTNTFITRLWNRRT